MSEVNASVEFVSEKTTRGINKHKKGIEEEDSITSAD
jgi:hypothetical protein